MPFDREWYLALKRAFSGLTAADKKVLRLVWKYPGVPVHYLPQKIGGAPSGWVNLAIGDRISRRKLWRKMPPRIRSKNQAKGYSPFYSGVIVKLTTVIDRQQRHFVCFDFHDEATKALKELKIISSERRERSAIYERIDDLKDELLLNPQNAPAELNQTLRSIKVRRGQVQFRKELLQAYGGACAVTGCKQISVLEAAHIRTFARKGRYNVANGILLRADWHTLFDLDLWAIHPKTRRILFSPKVLDSEYLAFAGRKIGVPNDPKCALDDDALNKRHHRFKKLNSRAVRK